jgi:hypothetical protein
MIDLSEHPMVLEVARRLREAEPKENFIAVTVLLPGMPNLMGELRLGKTPGLMLLTSNVKMGEGGEQGRVDFAFTAGNRPVILYPPAHEAPFQSGIVS